LETDRGRRRPLRPLPTRLPRHRRGGAEGRRQRVAAAAMNGSQEAKPPSLGEFIGAAAFLLGLISAWLYAAGWAYAYHYFDRFGIPLLMVDIPKENYPIYGGVVVRQFPIWALAIAVPALVLVGAWRWLGAKVGRLTVPLSLLAVAAVFWLGHQAGVAAAQRIYVQQRDTDYSGYPRVQVWPKEKAKPRDGSVEAATDL